jgi:PAS domain S-box-containing protein
MGRHIFRKAEARKSKERRRRAAKLASRSNASSARAAAKKSSSVRAAANSATRSQQLNLAPPVRRISDWLDSSGSSRALMDLAHDAIIIRDPASRIVSWNASAAQLYGWKAREAVGHVTHSLLDTKWPVSLEVANGDLFEKGYWEGELSHRRKDGARIIVDSRESLLRDSNGRPLLIKEINRDITEERRQLNYLRLLSEVSASVNEAGTIEEALRWSLASICLQTDWCAARACTVTVRGGEHLWSDPVWFFTDEKRMRRFRDAVDGQRRCVAAGCMASRVFQKDEPVWLENLRRDSHYALVLLAAGVSLQCAYGFPIRLGPEGGVVIELFSAVPKGVDAAFTNTMHDVGRHLGRLFERFGAEEAQRALSISLMRAQDDERRRIARELHDSTGQYLSALALAIDAARSHGDDVPPATVRKLEEATEIINRCSAELRTLSHLLHPPLLEELGLISAVNWYVDGFGERSGLQLDLALPAELPRFESSSELTIFRALQECLTNIHRHSGSKTAAVTLELDGSQLVLEVRDAGKGIEKETLGGWLINKKRPGVGISGMRERVRDLGGTLDIKSSPKGTSVRLAIPARQRTAPAIRAAEAAAAPSPSNSRNAKTASRSAKNAAKSVAATAHD